MFYLDKKTFNMELKKINENETENEADNKKAFVKILGSESLVDYQEFQKIKKDSVFKNNNYNIKDLYEIKTELKTVFPHVDSFDFIEKEIKERKDYYFSAMPTMMLCQDLLFYPYMFDKKENNEYIEYITNDMIINETLLVTFLKDKIKSYKESGIRKEEIAIIADSKGYAGTDVLLRKINDFKLIELKRKLINQEKTNNAEDFILSVIINHLHKKNISDIELLHLMKDRLEQEKKYVLSINKSKMNERIELFMPILSPHIDYTKELNKLDEFYEKKTKSSEMLFALPLFKSAIERCSNSLSQRKSVVTMNEEKRKDGVYINGCLNSGFENFFFNTFYQYIKNNEGFIHFHCLDQHLLFPVIDIIKARNPLDTVYYFDENNLKDLNFETLNLLVKENKKIIISIRMLQRMNKIERTVISEYVINILKMLKQINLKKNYVVSFHEASYLFEIKKIIKELKEIKKKSFYFLQWSDYYPCNTILDYKIVTNVFAHMFVFNTDNPVMPAIYNIDKNEILKLKYNECYYINKTDKDNDKVYSYESDLLFIPTILDEKNNKIGYIDYKTMDLNNYNFKSKEFYFNLPLYC